MLRTILAEVGGTLVSVVTSSKFKLRWGVLVGGLSWDVAISFAQSLGCGWGRLSGWDVYGAWVGCTTGSAVSGTSLVLLLGPASSTMQTGDMRSMR